MQAASQSAPGLGDGRLSSCYVYIPNSRLDMGSWLVEAYP